MFRTDVHLTPPHPRVNVCSLTKACPQACLSRNNRGQTPVEAAVSGARGEVLNAMLLACSGSSPRQAGKEEKEVRRCLPQQGQGREVLNAMRLACSGSPSCAEGGGEVRWFYLQVQGSSNLIPCSGSAKIVIVFGSGQVIACPAGGDLDSLLDLDLYLYCSNCSPHPPVVCL